MPITPTRVVVDPAGSRVAVTLRNGDFFTAENGSSLVVWPQVITAPATFWCDAKHARIAVSLVVEGVECATAGNVPRLVGVDQNTPWPTVSPSSSAVAAALGDRAFAAGLVDDLSGVSNAAAARANLRAAGLWTVQDLYAATIDQGRAIYVPHRGGGDIMAPENTMDAFDYGASLGLGIIDGGDLRDVRGTTSDCALCHDATVDAVTSATGDVVNKTINEWRGLTVDSSSWFYAGYGDTSAATWRDLCSRWGGRTVLLPEFKTAAASTAALKVVQEMRLEQSIIASSFALAHLTAWVSAGVECAWISNTGVEYTAAQLQAAGVNWVFVSTSASTPTIEAFIAGGMKVLVWTIGRRYLRDQYLALGVHAFACTDAAYLASDTDYRLTSDPYGSGYPYPGMLTGIVAHDQLTSSTYRGTLSGGWLVDRAGQTSAHSYLLGWACPIANAASTYTIGGSTRCDTLGSLTGQWFAVRVGYASDAQENDQVTDPECYACVLRFNGSMQIYRRMGGVVTQVGATTSSTAITTPGQIIPWTVQVTPTTITFTRTDTGSSVVATDSSFRGAYAYLMASPSSGGARWSFSDITIS